MNAKKIKAIVVGIGEMGKIGVQTLIDHEIEIVAAIDINEEIIGKDVAEHSGYAPIGVKIEKNLLEAVKREKPNVAFLASASELGELEQDLIICAENKIDVVTTAIEPYFPWNTNQELAKKIDASFKENGVSLFASGINDVFWSGIGIDLVGTCKRVDSIDFQNKLPLEGMGVGVAEEFQINCDPEAFKKEMANKDLAADPAVGGPLLALYVNAQILGLAPKDVSISVEPILAKADMPMPQWDMVIQEGRMLGQSFHIAMSTEQGILCTTSMVIKVLEEEEKSGTEWTIEGEPYLHLELGDICGEITTSTTAVNRIPDVINARPGIVTLADIPQRPIYRPGKWTHI